MRRRPGPRPSIVIALVGAAALVGCSGDPAVSGESVIEGEIAEQIGLGELEATCDDPGSREVGSTFGCTASTTDGQIIAFTAEFDSEDEIFVYPTNVISAGELALVEQEAAEVLSPEVGTTIDPSAVDCGEVTVVLATGGIMTCVITDQQTGERYELEATFSNHEREDGFFNRDYLIVGLLEE